MPLALETKVNRQIGDYVVVELSQFTAANGVQSEPYAVRLAGSDDALSYHSNVTAAVQAILRYRAADKRRAKPL